MKSKSDLESLPLGAQAARFMIADQVLSLRKARKLSMMDVARMGKTDRVTLAQIENPNDRAPNLTTLMRVADTLNADLIVTLKPRDGLEFESAMPALDTWGTVEFGSGDVWIGRVSDVSCFGIRMVQVDHPRFDGTVQTVKRPSSMVTGFYPMSEADARHWAGLREPGSGVIVLRAADSADEAAAVTGKPVHG